MNNKDSVTKVSQVGSMLAITAFFGIAIMSVTFNHAQSYIIHNEKQVLLRNLHTVLADSIHDNDITEDKISVIEPILGSHKKIDIYRARNMQRPVASVITSVAPNGYNGAIQLVVGINYAGELLGVRVVTHRETPGLGDAIESAKSDWILGFDHKSLANTPESEWKVKKDGGKFDQITGATITPRAIVAAVEKTLQYYRTSRDRIFSESDLSNVKEQP